jgi:putative transposase
MANYRRIKIEGGCFFFTVCLADRRATTLVDHIDDLKAAWRWTKNHKPFACPAWVVLPDHIHCIWKLPADDDDYAVRWKQRRFWEHAIRDERDLENHFAYIRGNPFRHGFVRNLEDWPHSSFHQNTGQNDAMS